MSGDSIDAAGSERILTGYSGRISLVLAVGWMATRLGRQVISPLLPAIIEGLEISPSRAGFALTVMLGLYGICQYPGGRISDSLSRTTVLGAGIGVMISGFVVLTISATYPTFLIGVSLVGVGGGFFFSPSRAFLSDLFVERRGQVFGLHTAAGMIGGILAAASATVVVSIATWRAAFLLPIALLLVVLGALHRWSRERYTLQWVSLEVRRTSSRLFASNRIRWILLGYTFFGFTIHAFTGFLPTLLQAEKGFSSGLAGGAFAMIYVTGIVAGPAAGRLSDRLPRTHVVVSSLTLAGVGVILLLLVGSAVPIYASVALTSAGLWAYVPAIQAYLMDILDNDSLGGDFGMLKAIYTALGSLGPTYVGVTAEYASYTVAFAGLVVCLFLSASILFAATRS